MTPRDYDQFCEAVLAFAELKGKQLSAPALELYWRALQDWALEDFLRAAEHLVTTCRWFPGPSDFTALRTAGEPTAGEAWEGVLRGDDLDPNSRAYRAARIVGGQYYIRHADIERDVPHIQRRFLEAYAELSDVEPVRAALPQIAAAGARIALRGPMPLASAIPQLERKLGEPAPEKPRVPRPAQ